MKQTLSLSSEKYLKPDLSQSAEWENGEGPGAEEKDAGKIFNPHAGKTFNSSLLFFWNGIYTLYSPVVHLKKTPVVALVFDIVSRSWEEEIAFILP